MKLKTFAFEIFIMLAAVCAAAIMARAADDPIVTVIPLPGVMAATYRGPAAVLVMIYNETPILGNYSVILPWIDKSGAPQSTAKDCTYAGVNTACVFNIDSVSEGTPVIAWTPAPQPRSLKKSETK